MLWTLILWSTAFAAFCGDFRTVVFSPGDYGSKFYRIPALTVAADGSLIAVADKRLESNADLPGKIDVVCRRSTDGGRTWSNPITIAAHDSVGGYGDPAVITDSRTGHILVISTHGNGLWQKEPGHISVSRSKDNGLTWLPAVDINPQILSSDSTAAAPIYCQSAFASSGRAAQLDDGRIIFALVTRRPGIREFPVYAVYSDDSGHTWQVSATPATLDGDEAKIVQLPDGTLMMSIRARGHKYRNFSFSDDRGLTWCEMKGNTTLPAATCNGEVIRFSLRGKDVLLHTLPSPDGKRNDITIHISEDRGATWRPMRVINPGPGAYSSMVQLPDGSLATLTEEAPDPSRPGTYQIIFTRIEL